MFITRQKYDKNFPLFAYPTDPDTHEYPMLNIILEDENVRVDFLPDGLVRDDSSKDGALINVVAARHESGRGRRYRCPTWLCQDGDHGQGSSACFS